MTETVAMRRLAEVAAIKSGGTPLRSEPRYWEPYGVRWVTTSEISGSRILDTEQHISALGLRNSSAKLFPPGTVLIAMYGQGATRGKAAILDVEAATNQACAALLPRPGLDAEYLFQYMLNSYEELRLLSNSGSQKNLSASLIGGFPIPVPSVPEQRKIAKILRTWDEAIEQSRQARANAETRHRAVAAALFMGGLSDGWDHHSLGTVSKRITRTTDGGAHVIMTISARSGFVAQSAKYRRDMAGASAATYTLLRRGEFAYNKGNSILYPQGCIYRLRNASALVPSVYVSFALDDDLNHTFYEQYFREGMLNRQLARRISSGVRNNGLLNITPKDFLDVQVPVPPRDQQDAVAAALDASHAEIELLAGQLQLLRQQKRGLMQKLLTGVVRVQVDEEMAP